MKDFVLPTELKEYREKVETSIKPYIKVIGEPNGNLSSWESKFCGRPYIPIDFEYPKDASGKPMKLLAQINFEEVPKIEDYPKEGILQFYISADDHVYGMDFDDGTNQENFRVIYFSDIVKDQSKLLDDFSFIEDLNTEYFPIKKVSKLYFEKDFDIVSISDYRFKDFFGKKAFKFFEQFGEKKEELYNWYFETFNSTGHKIGGYGFFTQYDPRETGYKDYEKLLFQIDTDADLDIMWGDCGVANFFMRKKDLKNSDFTKVLYNWDCS